VRSAAETIDSGDAVEAAVEAEDSGHAVALHRREMDRIARRQPGRPVQKGLRPLHIHTLHREDLVHDAEQRVEGRLDRVTPRDRDVSMQDLLQDLRVRGKSGSILNALSTPDENLTLSNG